MSRGSNDVVVQDEARDRLEAILRRPPGEHVGALSEYRAAFAPPDVPEAWNTAFGPGSLFDAWTQTPLMRGVYAANAAVLRPTLTTPGWTVIEVGGGDGALWREALLPDDRGTLVVVDPAEAPHDRVREAVPPGVVVVSVRSGIAEASLPEADAVVCSLTLHHVAGEDATRRARWGLPGPGKAEILTRMAEALRPRDGLVVLNEADVYCDLGLAPGDGLLADRIVDSYVRRCARALLDAIDRVDDPALAARWWAIVRRWCVDQIEVVGAAPEARDVYELDVPRWLDVLDAAGLTVLTHRFTDRYNLFHQYVARPA